MSELFIQLYQHQQDLTFETPNGASRDETIDGLLLLAWQQRQRNPTRAALCVEKLRQTVLYDDLQPAANARIHLIEGEDCWLSGDLTAARRHAESAHRLFKQEQNKSGDGDAFLLDYHIEVDQGNVQQWQVAMSNACEAYRQADDEERFAAAMAYRATAEAFSAPSAYASDFLRNFESGLQVECASLGLVYFAVATRFSIESQFARAADYYRHSSAVLNTYGLIRASINAELNVAISQQSLGLEDESVQTMTQALERARTHGFPQPLGLALSVLGETYSKGGADLLQGYRYLQSAKHSLKPLRGSRTYVLVLLGLGYNTLSRVEAPEALAYFEEAVDSSRRSHHRQLLPSALAGLAECQSMLDRPLEALETALESRLCCDVGDVQQMRASLLSLARVCRRHQHPAPSDSPWPSGDLHYLNMLTESCGPIEDTIDDELLLEHVLAWERQGDFRRALHYERQRRIHFEAESKRMSKTRLTSMKAQQRAIIAEADAGNQRKIALAEKRRTETLERLANFIRQLTSTLDIADIVQAIGFGIESLMGDVGMVCWLVDNAQVTPQYLSLSCRGQDHLLGLASTRATVPTLEEFRRQLGMSTTDGFFLRDGTTYAELSSGARTLGFLAVSAANHHPLDQHAHQIFGTVCGHVAIALSNARNYQEIKSSHDQLRAAQAELHQLANVDALTGLASRRNILQLAEREITRARRHHEELALLLLDLDHFKNINDSFGHASGDSVLRAVSVALMSELRMTDCLGRWGGEELVAVLYSSGPAHTRMVAERLRTCVEGLCIPVSDGAQFTSITVSIGAAQWSPCEESLDSLLRRADVALYDAKNHGRNRVTFCDERAGAAPDLLDPRLQC